MSYPVRLIETLLLLGGLLPVSGCTALGNLFDNPDNTAEPAELVDFESTIKVRTVWQRRVGSGAGKLFLKLRPAVDGASCSSNCARRSTAITSMRRPAEAVFVLSMPEPVNRSGIRKPTARFPADPVSATNWFCSAPAMAKCWLSVRKTTK